MRSRIIVTLIWISGLLAFACIGTTLGYALRPDSLGARAGFVGGAAAFVCLRLWLTQGVGGKKTSQESNMWGDNSLGRFTLAVTALFFLGITVHLALEDRASAAMVTAATGGGLLFFTFLPVFESFQAFGIRAKLRVELDRAELLLKQIRDSAKISAEMTATQLAWSDRLGGVPLIRRVEMLQRLESHLSDIGAPVAKEGELLEPLLLIHIRDIGAVWGQVVERRRKYWKSKLSAEHADLSRAEDPAAATAASAVGSLLTLWNQDRHISELLGIDFTPDQLSPAMSAVVNSYPFPEDERDKLLALGNQLANTAKQYWERREVIPSDQWAAFKANKMYSELFTDA